MNSSLKLKLQAFLDEAYLNSRGQEIPPKHDRYFSQAMTRALILMGLCLILSAACIIMGSRGGGALFEWVVKRADMTFWKHLMSALQLIGVGGILRVVLTAAGESRIGQDFRAGTARVVRYIRTSPEYRHYCEEREHIANTLLAEHEDQVTFALSREHLVDKLILLRPVFEHQLRRLAGKILVRQELLEKNDRVRDTQANKELPARLRSLAETGWRLFGLIASYDVSNYYDNPLVLDSDYRELDAKPKYPFGLVPAEEVWGDGEPSHAQ